MALILADTDVLIDFLVSREPIRSVVERLFTSENLRISAVTCFELLSGATDGRRGDKVRQLVNDLEVIPLDREAAKTAARVRRELESRGEGIGMGDSLIAGIALANDLPVYTLNVKHFNRVDELRLFRAGT